MCSLDGVLTAAEEGEGVQIPIQQNTEKAHTHTDISDQMLRDTHIHALLWPKSQKRAHTILTSGSFRPSLQPPANTYVCLLLIQTNTFKKNNIKPTTHSIHTQHSLKNNGILTRTLCH